MVDWLADPTEDGFERGVYRKLSNPFPSFFFFGMWCMSVIYECDRYVSCVLPLNFLLTDFLPLIASSTTFYSLHIWPTAAGDDSWWNPGDNEGGVGLRIVDVLTENVKNESLGAAERGVLEKRMEDVGDAVSRMEYGEWWVWWLWD